MKKLFSFYIGSFRGLPRRAWFLFLAQLVNASGTMVIFFMTLYLTIKRELPLPMAGQAVGAFGVGSMAGTFFGGLLADRLGMYFIQKASLLLTGIFLLILAWELPFGVILILCVFWGISNGMLFPANSSAMAAECPGKLRTRGFVMIRLANNLGATVAPVIGGILAYYNYSLLFIVDAVSCFIAAIVLWIAFPEKGFHAHDDVAHDDAVKKTVQSASKKRSSFSASLATVKPLLFILLSTLALTTIIGQIFSTWAPYLRQTENFSESQIGMLLAVSTMMIVFFQMPIIHALESRSHTIVAITGALFYVVGFGILPLGHGVFWQLLSVFIWTWGEMLAFPSLMSFISDLAPRGKQGKYQGFFSLMFSMGIAVGPTLGTYIAHVYSWSALWYATSSLGIAAAVFLLLSRKPVA